MSEVADKELYLTLYFYFSIKNGSDHLSSNVISILYVLKWWGCSFKRKRMWPICRNHMSRLLQWPRKTTAKYFAWHMVHWIIFKTI